MDDEKRLSVIRDIIKTFGSASSAELKRLETNFLRSRYAESWDKLSEDLDDEDGVPSVSDLLDQFRSLQKTPPWAPLIIFLKDYALASLEEDWIGVPSAELLLSSLLDVLGVWNEL